MKSLRPQSRSQEAAWTALEPSSQDSQIALTPGHLYFSVHPAQILTYGEI